MGTFAGTLIGLLGAALGATTTPRDRRRSERVAEGVFPGRLRVVSARTLFPASAGSEVLFGLDDDPDAVVRVLAGGAEPTAASIRQAVADAQAKAQRWRTLNAAFADGGHRVHALGRLVADPWVAAELTNDTVAGVMDGLVPCLARSGVTSLLIADPATVAELPAPDPDRPTLLRLTDRRLLAALSGHRTCHRLSYTAGSVELGLVRPFEQQQVYESRAAASAGRWLAGAVPDAEVTAVLGVSRLLPGRVDQVRGYVVFRDEPEQGRVPLGNHALLVTTGLDGELAAEPTVLRDVREGRGPLRLPPL
jgi:hypothetical protein